MSDVNEFIDSIGKDVSASVVPKIEEFADTISTRTSPSTVLGCGVRQ